jgi:hypothetical protein
MAHNGIGGLFKIAEFDELSTSNLNRVQAGLSEIGERKLDVITRQIYELNPYQEFEPYESGLDEGALRDFLGGQRKPDVVFEAVDDFELKIQLRLEARKNQVPVIMLTNLHDSILIDVERYDLDKALPIFNGAIGDVPEQILKGVISDADKVRYALKIVSLENTPTRALETLLEINHTVVGRPQLASTVAIGGGIAAWLARRIILGHETPSGRYRVKFAEWLNVNDSDYSEQREELVGRFSRRMAV